jgi:hypothetical protein
MSKCVTGASASSGRPASARPIARETLLPNSTPATVRSPQSPSTTTVFSASSRCPAGTGSVACSPPAIVPARSK